MPVDSIVVLGTQPLAVMLNGRWSVAIRDALDADVSDTHNGFGTYDVLAETTHTGILLITNQ